MPQACVPNDPFVPLRVQYDLAPTFGIPSGAFGTGSKLVPKVKDQPADSHRLLRIDTIHLIVTAVIVFVGTVEKEEDRDSLAGEVVVVGTEVETLVGPDVVDGGHAEFGMGLIDEPERLAEI